MVRIFSLSLCIVTLIVSPTFGQDENMRIGDRIYARKTVSSGDTVYSEIKRGKITVIEDSRISKLNELKRKYPGLQDGYRVQLFFGDRTKAMEKKAQFTNVYPDIPAYISYLAPNFRLRVGDFRSRMEGEKLKKEIESEYPGCYLVKDKIQLPKLEEGDLESE